MNELFCNNIEEWRNWLHENHLISKGVWLLFYKKSKNVSVNLEYESAITEAICYGWIDSIVKKKDESTYLRKFTPRRVDSLWSESNKKRILKLEKEDRLNPNGKLLLETSIKNGTWNKVITSKGVQAPAIELILALKNNINAEKNFKNFSKSKQKLFIKWINSAKKEETQERRIKEVIERLEKGLDLGLK